MNRKYDLVVIGAGTAAMGVATRVRAAGWTVAVADFRPFGGTCALRGCDPKKMLISGTSAIDQVARMRGNGVAGDVRIDWSKLMAFKRTFTDPVAERQEATYRDKGIDTFHGQAKFMGKYISKRKRKAQRVGPQRRRRKASRLAFCAAGCRRGRLGKSDQVGAKRLTTYHCYATQGSG